MMAVRAQDPRRTEGACLCWESGANSAEGSGAAAARGVERPSRGRNEDGHAYRSGTSGARRRGRAMETRAIHLLEIRGRLFADHTESAPGAPISGGPARCVRIKSFRCGIGVCKAGNNGLSGPAVPRGCRPRRSCRRRSPGSCPPCARWIGDAPPQSWCGLSIPC